MPETRPRIRLVDGKLVLPEGMSLVEAIALLKPLDPTRTWEDGEPCVLVAESPEFSLRLPGINEHIYVDNGPEHTALEIFWVQEGDADVLVCLNCYYIEETFIVIREDDTWHAMPVGKQMLRRLANAKDAHALRYPNGVICSAAAQIGSWHTIELHSAQGSMLDLNGLDRDPNMISAFEFPGRIEAVIPVGTWDQRLGGCGHTDLMDVAPELAKEIDTDGEKSHFVLHQIVIATHHQTNGVMTIIVAYQRPSKLDHVVLAWRIVPFKEWSTLFPDPLPKQN